MCTYYLLEAPVARTVVAPPSIVVQCLWGVFVWGFGVLFLSCACVSRVLFSLCVCVCDLLIFLPGSTSTPAFALMKKVTLCPISIFVYLYIYYSIWVWTYILCIHVNLYICKCMWIYNHLGAPRCLPLSWWRRSYIYIYIQPYVLTYMCVNMYIMYLCTTMYM